MFKKFQISKFKKSDMVTVIDIVLKRVMLQKQSSIGVLRKRCSENLQLIYRRTPMPKCDFNFALCNLIEITPWHRCSPVNLLHIFRTPFLRTPLEGCFWCYYTNSTKHNMLLENIGKYSTERKNKKEPIKRNAVPNREELINYQDDEEYK